VSYSINSGYLPLTSKGALFRFKAVFNARVKHPHALRRFVSAGILLFVFFLPLHFHSVAATAHVAKECSCIHGKRTEMGMAPVQVDWAPPIRQVFYEPFELQLSSHVVTSLQLIRAPPTL